METNLNHCIWASPPARAYLTGLTLEERKLALARFDEFCAGFEDDGFLQSEPPRRANYVIRVNRPAWELVDKLRARSSDPFDPWTKEHISSHVLDEFLKDYSKANPLPAYEHERD
jgi:hypothetical protein